MTNLYSVMGEANKVKTINPRYSTDKLTAAYAHVGLYDVVESRMWIAKKRFNTEPVRVSHARLILGGTHDTSTADKDKFICYWLHTPGVGSGLVHGYPIDWSEGHLLVRLDPNWDYRNRAWVARTETARVEKNIDQQYAWGRKLFDAYVQLEPSFPVSWHMIGPRAAESMFYIQRFAPAPGSNHAPGSY